MYLPHFLSLLSTWVMKTVCITGQHHLNIWTVDGFHVPCWTWPWRHWGRTHVCVLSCFNRVWLFATLWTAACQAPLSVGLFQQEHWSGFACPPGESSHLGTQLTSLMSPAATGRFFTTSTDREAYSCMDSAKPSRKNFLLSCATRVFPGNSVVKNLPAMQETWVRSLGWKDPLEEGRTTHSSILAWRIPWTVEPGGLQPMGSQKSQT